MDQNNHLLGDSKTGHSSNMEDIYQYADKESRNQPASQSHLQIKLVECVMLGTWRLRKNYSESE